MTSPPTPAVMAGSRGRPAPPRSSRWPDNDPRQQQIRDHLGVQIGDRVRVVAYPVVYVGELDKVKFSPDGHSVLDVWLVDLVRTDHNPFEWNGKPLPVRVVIPWRAIDRFETLAPDDTTREV